jgi:uncharacterized protein YcbK (DUF882 family)
MKLSDRSQLSRRKFCALGAMAAGALLMPRVAGAAARLSSEKTLAFWHTHTRESLAAPFCCDGRYDPAVLDQINYLLRDFRANEVKPIDVRLLDLLHALNGELLTSEPYHVISGYRSPHTNTMLQGHGGAQSGVATRSLHMVGQAIDIRVPGVPLKELHKAAASLKRGGVGMYPAPDFVHVDVGRVRYW